jgi:hypothetical protein
MNKPWSEMTPEERREQRFQWLLEPDMTFPSPQAERAYKTRVQRLIDVFHVREPDVVPVNLPIGILALERAGLNYHDLLYEPEKAFAATREFAAETGIESPLGIVGMPGRMLDLLDYKQYDWPGRRGLSVNAPGYQYNEGEYMMADEYDHLIRDPSDFWLRVYFPRVFGALEPFRRLMPATDVVEIPALFSYFAPFADPAMRDALRRLIEVGEAIEDWRRRTGVRTGGGTATPGLMNTIVKAPFDTLGDTLRGTKQIMLDMRRRPDKLLAAMEVVAEFSIANAVAALNASRGVMAFFPLHKGADGWMSQQQFEKFYWPSLRKVIWGLINEGVQVYLFAEGGYDSRLEFVNEFPKGTVAWRFDRTDMARAKRILGANCCIAGNVPASLLRTGTPAEVKAYCRKLIEDCAPGGGYILDSGTGNVDHVSLENLLAMRDAAEEYGVYSRPEAAVG